MLFLTLNKICLLNKMLSKFYLITLKYIHIYTHNSIGVYVTKEKSYFSDHIQYFGKLLKIIKIFSITKFALFRPVVITAIFFFF